MDTGYIKLNIEVTEKRKDGINNIVNAEVHNLTSQELVYALKDGIVGIAERTKHKALILGLLCMLLTDEI